LVATFYFSDISPILFLYDYTVKTRLDFPKMCGILTVRFAIVVNLNKGKMKMDERIDINANICHGKPVIKGTRVLVSNILGALSAGESIDEILEDYPNISRQDVYATIEFGAELSRFEESPYKATV